MKRCETLEQITEDTNFWTHNLDIVSPIDTSRIRGFARWVNWSGWKGYDQEHTAYDFAAYMDTKERCVLGLPKGTLVRAIADGIVNNENDEESYYNSVYVYHGANRGLASCYVHVVPLKEDSTRVKKGEPIAILYADRGTLRGELVHLHFELFEYDGNDADRFVNPEEIYRDLNHLVAQPQGSNEFTISGLEIQPSIKIANFHQLA